MTIHRSVYVRAAADDRCNLNCIYCPRFTGMENYVPAEFRGKKLSLSSYVRNLGHLARNGIRNISFTGGEPTLNPALPVLVAEAARLFDRVEVTTNGFRLAEYLAELAPNLSLLKVSLDAVEPRAVAMLTQGSVDEAKRAVDSIRAGCMIGLRVGVNCVLLRSNRDQIGPLLEVCRSINSEGFPGRCYVSVLDFYYTPERRETWLSEFVPVHQVMAALTGEYGSPTIEDRFGCRFFWIDAGGVEVRFKDSYGATQRAQKCHGCKQYCQEGIYGLKHSIEGWVTTCPSSDSALGVRLYESITDHEADHALEQLLRDIETAQPNSDAFEVMLRTHDLNVKPIS
jgi:molybdenum cofactor biosynthesis enzyme MoaA